VACPSSPEPDGYHRFKLAPKGLEFETRCIYCGAEKLLKPFDDTATTTDQRGRRQSPRQQIAIPPRDAVAARARAERGWAEGTTENAQA
jgi:hypothetical protein